MSRRIKNSRKKEKNPVLIITGLVITIVAIIACFNYISTVNSNNNYQIATGEIHAEKIYSENVILLDAKNGEKLYGKNENNACYPASLTKIMTAITAISNRETMDSKVSLNSSTINQLKNENAAMVGLNSGEKATVKDLLYGCILASGADASMALSKAISGSEKSFVSLMDKKAEEFGLDRTSFVNTTGLHDNDHYTTAEDMSRLLYNALKNPTFRDVFTTKSYNIQTNEREIAVESTFFSKYRGESDGYVVEGAKTGTTSEAGLCLAALVLKDGREYILVTMKAPIGEADQPFSFNDLDYIFSVI